MIETSALLPWGGCAELTFEWKSLLRMKHEYLLNTCYCFKRFLVELHNPEACTSFYFHFTSASSGRARVSQIYVIGTKAVLPTEAGCLTQTQHFPDTTGGMSLLFQIDSVVLTACRSRFWG